MGRRGGAGPCGSASLSGLASHGTSRAARARARVFSVAVPSFGAVAVTGSPARPGAAQAHPGSRALLSAHSMPVLTTEPLARRPGPGVRFT